MSMVDYVSIGSLIKRIRTKAKDKYNDVPVYAVTNSQGFALSSSLHDFTIHSEDTSNYLLVSYNDFAYNPSRLNIGSISYFTEEGHGLISPMYVVFHADEKKVNPQYLYINIKSQAVRNKIESLKEVGARFRFDFNRWDLIHIPLPPLSEQERIVGILDTFTAAIDNLKEQIAQRRKQFEYYRDQLLEISKDVPYKPIKDVVFSHCSGATPNKGHLEYYEGGKVPWLRTQDVRFNEIYEIDSYITHKAVQETGVKWIPSNCVIVAISGATAGRCAINKFPTTTNQHCLNLEIDSDKALYKFVYYCVFNAYKELISKKQGARGDLNSSLVLGTIIPVPPISEQQRIVSILDTFEASISNLEAQLAQREKQYEYYRNKLLTFK